MEPHVPPEVGGERRSAGDGTIANRKRTDEIRRAKFEEGMKLIIDCFKRIVFFLNMGINLAN